MIHVETEVPQSIGAELMVAVQVPQRHQSEAP